MTTKRGTCLSAGIICFFEKQQPRHPKSLGLSIAERHFVSRTKPIVTEHCCDKCSGVSKESYAEWVSEIPTET